MLILFASNSNAHIVISEFMGFNSSAIYDLQNVDSTDLIELFNESTSDLDFGGYFLTDNLSDTMKWKILFCLHK